MKKLTCIFITCLAGLHFAAAGGTDRSAATATKTANAPASEQTASSSSDQPAATIELKKKSSFALEPNSRNPFWPIGWKPVAKQTSTTEQAGPEVSPNAFVITSIMMDQGSHRFAIINGKPMQEGQVFGLQMGNQVYQITVKTIEDGQVILQRRDQEIAVPLRRK